jgi:creatinine amidohydrolase
MLLQEMTWPEIEGKIKQSIIVLPIGSTEQHGRHLPLGTDILIAYEVLLRALQRAPIDLNIIVAPPVSIGLSIEHLEFPGTLTMKDAESLISYVKNICNNFVTYGARKIVIWNGHGGNTSSLMTVVRAVRRETGALVVMAQWFEMISPTDMSDITDTECHIHADETETSVMLYLFPELVQMTDAVKELPEDFLKSTYFKNLDGTPYVSWLTKDVSKSGVIGDPMTATREKGEKIVEAAINGTCNFLKEVSAIKI